MNEGRSNHFKRLQQTMVVAACKRRLRSWISRYMRHKIHTKATVWPARSNHTTLIIAPHPDDEALGCGGLITRRALAGEAVHIVYLTDGSGSHPHHPQVSSARLAALRASEARMAANALGVTDEHLVFLNAPDGRLPHLSDTDKTSLIDTLAQLIQAIVPGEIFVTATADGSTEHTAANALLRKAAARAHSPARILEYPVWSRWNPRLLTASIRHATQTYTQALTPEELARKHQAIGCHHSQIKPLAPWDTAVLSPEFLGYFYDPEEFYFEFQSSANPPVHAQSIQ